MLKVRSWLKNTLDPGILLVVEVTELLIIADKAMVTLFLK